jgi:outer membrane protein OmpA-like peptidoglycan-associated protein
MIFPMLRRVALGSVVCSLFGLTVWTGAARADEAGKLYIGGFSGLNFFSSSTELGNSWAAEQVPNTSMMFGLRVGVSAYSALAQRHRYAPSFAVEAELKFAPSFTGSGLQLERDNYFAPVFGFRGHGVASVQVLAPLSFHAVLGVGGESVVSSSPFMADDTDPIVYWGLGAKASMGDRKQIWKARFDMRHGLMAGRMDTVSSTFEFQLGVEASFGTGTGSAPTRRSTRLTVGTIDVKEPADKCSSDPTQSQCVTVDPTDANKPEVPPIVQAKDRDADGADDRLDKCPEQAEDFDGFEDEDGCPDLDNDEDGIADVQDRCPNEKESANGVADDDGCPEAVSKSSQLVKFTVGKARLSATAQAQLVAIATAVRTMNGARITLVAFVKSAKDSTLANRRLETTKWFLIDRGIDATGIDTVVESVTSANGTSKQRGQEIELRIE